MKAGEDRVTWNIGLLIEPKLKGGSYIDAQGCAPRFPAFPHATDMGACSERDILAVESGDFAVAQASLDRDKQKGSIPSTDPCGLVGGVHQGGALSLGKKRNRAAIMPLPGNRQDALALQGEGWFLDGDESKECTKSGEAVIPAPDGGVSISFKVGEEFTQ
jgi:hypothetical protein